MNLLKTDEVFFIRLTTTAAVKKIIKSTKPKEHNAKHYDTKQHKKQPKKTNCNTTIYQDWYIMHPNIDSDG